MPEIIYPSEKEPQRFSFFRSQVLAAVLGVAVVGMGGYSIYEHHAAKTMAEQNAQIASSLKTTNAQVEQLTTKLNEMSNPQPPAPTAPKAVHTAKHSARRTKTRMVRTRDGQWKKIQVQLDAQGKAIESTRQDLASAKTELQGSIARTHDELVVLQRKGERNYTEFDVPKSKEFRTQGPVGIRLRKANVKNQYADLELMVDDVKLTKKHVNLYEPAMFYSPDTEQPIQVVINRITKDHIHGYVSAPKYRSSELNALQGASGGASAAQPQRVRMTAVQ